MSIISLPTPCRHVEAVTAIPKGSQASSAHYIGFHLVITVPIDIQPHDELVVDMRTGEVFTIERGGIAIWRSGWLN